MVINTLKEHSSDKKEGIIKKKHTNKFIAFGQLMLLAMNVLKNSEEIHEENLKADSYTRILKNSISYVVLYKMICEEIINHFEEFPKERVEEFKFVLRFLPVIHQNLISDNLGTYKLAEVIKEKIEADKVSGNKAVISEFVSDSFSLSSSVFLSGSNSNNSSDLICSTMLLSI